MKTRLLLLLLICTTGVFSQNEQLPRQSKKGFIQSLGFSVGVNDFHLLDQYLSPYIFTKTFISSQVTYQLKTVRYQHTIDFSYCSGHPNSTVQPRDVTQKIGTLSYSLLRVIGEKQMKGNPIELSLGGGVSSLIANTNFIAIDKQNSYQYFDQSWYCSNSINLLLRSEYLSSERNSFSLQFTQPLFLIVSRPQNGHGFNQQNAKVIHNFPRVLTQGKPEFIWNNIVIASLIGYKHQLSNRCNLNVNYLFNYVTSDRPVALQMYMNRI